MVQQRRPSDSSVGVAPGLILLRPNRIPPAKKSVGLAWAISPTWVEKLLPAPRLLWMIFWEDPRSAPPPVAQKPTSVHVMPPFLVLSKRLAR